MKQKSNLLFEKNKYIKNYSQFKNNKLNEELNIGDVFSNLFKSKERKQLDINIKEWDLLNKNFIEIFSKNNKWKEYLNKFGYLDGVTDNLYKYWRSFIESDTVHYPFKVNGKQYTELNTEEISLLKKMIEQSIKMRIDLIEIINKVKKSSTLLEQNWKKITDEFGLEKLNKIQDSREIKENINTKISLIKTILEGLNDGKITQSSLINLDLFNKLISDIFLSNDIEDYRMEKNKKINYLKVFLTITESYDSQKVKDKIKSQLEFISNYSKMKDMFVEMEIDKLISDCSLNIEIDVVGGKITASDICKNLDFSPNKFSNKKEEFEQIKKVSTALINSNFDLNKSIENLNDLCDSVLNRDSFLEKLQITTSQIIKENNLTDKDIFFTHSSKIKDLTLDKVKFEYDVEIRGNRDETTPENAYGFYMTSWKNGERRDYDAASYMYRSKESAGFFGYDNIHLYVIDLKNDAKFLKSIEANFSQTNQSIKEFADYCKSIGLSGYYHPRPYGDNSSLEIVIVDKNCVQNFNKNDESKEIILKSMKK
jgi:hypothetical protein